MNLEQSIVNILGQFKNGLTKRELTKILNNKKIHFNSTELKEVLWHKLIRQNTIVYQKDNFKFLLHEKNYTGSNLISDFAKEFELYKLNFKNQKKTDINILLSTKDILVDQIISNNTNIEEIEEKLTDDQKQFLFLDRRLHIHINTFRNVFTDVDNEKPFNPLVELQKLANEFYADGKITQSELLILDKYSAEFNVSKVEKEKIISNAIEKNKNNFNLDYLLYFHINCESHLSNKEIIENFAQLYQIKINDLSIEKFLDSSPKSTDDFDYQFGQFTYKVKLVPYTKISSTFLFDMLRINNTHYEIRINEKFGKDTNNLSHIICDAITFEYCSIMEFGIDDFLEYKKLILESVQIQCSKI